jgi:hypothetical protein
MQNISLNKLFDLYNDTLCKCGIYLLNEEDEIINYNIFEEFDIGVISFLQEDSLQKLLDGKLINQLEFVNSLKLRYMVLNLQNSNEWNIKSLRTSTNWFKVMVLADKIKRFKEK